jgi:hypothetical protein
MDPLTYAERTGRIEQEIYKLKQLFSKEEEHFKPVVSHKELG